MEKVSLGGNSENRETIFFVGYIIEGSIRYNWKESYVEFKVGSPEPEKVIKSTSIFCLKNSFSSFKIKDGL